MTLIKCVTCAGTGPVECCGGHMCPGKKDCYDCNGKGKRLSDKDRLRKKELEELMRYK